MTPLTARLAQAISPHFPQDSVFVHVDSRERAAFDADGLANDLVGTAHFIVTETRPTGFFDQTQSTYRSKRFSYFLRDGRDLILRELDPDQALDTVTGLAQAPTIRRPYPTRTESSFRRPTFEEARAWALEEARGDPVTVFVGNIDARPGNEVEFLRRGIQSLGIFNILSGIYPAP